MGTDSARKIQKELAKLGIHLGKTTISRYLPKIGPAKDPQQRWMLIGGRG